MARRFDHVAFDLDGTLVDSRADLAASVNHVLDALGRPQLSVDQLTGFIGEGARRLVERALAAVGDDRVEMALDRFLAHYGTHLLDRTRPYEQIEDLLEGLAAAGVALSVVSNKPESMCRSIIAGLGWTVWLTVVIGGDTCPRRKPDPSGLVRACGAIGAPAARTLMVGDSVVDLQTARAAGVEFCGVGWGFAPVRLRDARPERMVTTPAALRSVVLR